MPDYKEMYLKLFRATENAVNLRIDAQQACEEFCITAPEPEFFICHGIISLKVMVPLKRIKGTPAAYAAGSVEVKAFSHVATASAV